jgi:hypothetical protein
MKGAFSHKSVAKKHMPPLKIAADVKKLTVKMLNVKN